MRAVSAVFKFDQLGVRHLRRNLIDLRHRSVRIANTLYGYQRRFDGVQQGPNVKASERFTQPDIVPLPKGDIDILVKCCQSRSQFFKVVASL